MNLCHPNQFIEAPQWIVTKLRPNNHDRFTVAFVAVDNCEYIQWPKESLIELMDSNKDIYHALQAVLGNHCANALLKSRQYRKCSSKKMTAELQSIVL